MSTGEKNGNTVGAKHCNEQTESARLVLFMGGFDPRGARYYHHLMRTESKKQAAIYGDRRYVVGPRYAWKLDAQKKSMHSIWNLHQELPGGKVSTDFLFFDWHDLVRSNWPVNRWKVWISGLATYATVWRSRKWLEPIHKQAPFTLWTLAYPLIYTVFILLFGVFSGVGISWLVQTPPFSTWGIFFVCMGLALMCMGGLFLDQHIHVSWLLRILNFAHKSSLQTCPMLDARMETVAESINDGMKQGLWREVVVVGFSVGSVQAIKMMTILRKYQGLVSSPVVASKPAVSLITLGNCIPLFALFPGAAALRQEIRSLALDPAVYWADISSPSDSVCFGMCDVVGLSLREDGWQSSKPDASFSTHGAGLRRTNGQWGVNPQDVCSPRFHKLFTSTKYRWLRRNKMRMHFQYLMAGEVVGSYDYFELLSSPGLVRDYIRKKLFK